MERFYNDKADADNPGSSAVTVTTEAYQRRLAKASLAIRTVLNSPDIIGTQEIENLAVLTDLAAKVSADAVAAGQADPLYVPYLYLANDGTAINTGFLVKSTRVNTVKVEQLGLTTTFTNSQGNQAILNDRTPLVLHAGIKRGGTAPDYPVTVISVHQRSLINVDDPTSTGATVRLKREAQAEYLAKLIQGYQAAGEHVVTVGDYNAFEFSDGFADTIGVTKGTPVPASQVITPPVAGLASPPLVDLVTLLPADQRQSYVETGSAQVLDHVLVTQDLVPTNTRLVYAHIDSDWPLVNLNDATSPTRISDHDPAVAYFTVPPVAGTVQLMTTATLTQLGDGSYQAAVTVKNNGTGTAQNVTLTGAILGSASGSPLPAALGDVQPGASGSVMIVFPASAGAPGSATAERYTGIYTGGSFSGAIRATLPNTK
jgi:predicted extracellular nuclease